MTRDDISWSKSGVNILCGMFSVKHDLWIDPMNPDLRSKNGWPIIVKCFECNYKGRVKLIKWQRRWIFFNNDMFQTNVSRPYYGCCMCGMRFKNKEKIKIVCYRCNAVYDDRDSFFCNKCLREKTDEFEKIILKSEDCEKFL
ncbi:hypothetical protein EDEG_01718 [Edhazardia aedis USNM 41457]|uniref:Uncharacterized protein n=1 Tax=Edhazardia aedis (strain USNM 41457) TaxID=1003232 RepID=J9DN70_EDHAE|nr:hypothetical protein EDEG_01718 [Edhazardia aedis USNM 41457]|eukprot:EJW03985.1 hypothetical protein EDEG_01718 [Edhazardia aedis USNM 41457]